MKYYGRIFEPDKFGIEYAKSPQAIVLDDVIRVFFSYCVPDNGKLISRIGSVDYKKDFSEIIDVSKDIISDGELGTFDEHGIFPLSPFMDDGVLKGITTGWSRRCSVSVDTALGLVISDDNGRTFKRYGKGPIMSSNVNEPYLIADGFIVKTDDGKYVMYYIYGTKWSHYEGIEQSERTYKIALSQSNNLLDWERSSEQIIASKFDDEAQALPSVAKYRNKWHMLFCYRHTTRFREDSQFSYKIGYASSNDLFNWKRNDDVICIPLEGWNKEMQCYPNIFVMDNEPYMLFNGNNFGKTGFGLVKLEGLI